MKRPVIGSALLGNAGLIVDVGLVGEVVGYVGLVGDVELVENVKLVGNGGLVEDVRLVGNEGHASFKVVLEGGRLVEDAGLVENVGLVADVGLADDGGLVFVIVTVVIVIATDVLGSGRLVLARATLVLARAGLVLASARLIFGKIRFFPMSAPLALRNANLVVESSRHAGAIAFPLEVVGVRLHIGVARGVVRDISLGRLYNPRYIM